MSAITQTIPDRMPQLRPLNIMRDLPRVADLVETCFSGTMDAEGQRFIQQMRRAGQDHSFLRWATTAVESASMPLSGYVWEESGQLVGNVSLIPYRYHGRKIFLIANVAVHPDHRRRGLARQLTGAAMEHCSRHNADSTWLQVRDDNAGAIELYTQLGFQERARRTQWIAAADKQLPNENRGFEIRKRVTADWTKQREWLTRIYPEDLAWYQPIPWTNFTPGLLPGISRFFMESETHTWSVDDRSGLLAAITWISSFGRSQPLWAAIPEGLNDRAFTALLLFVRRVLSGQENLLLDLPGGLAIEALHSAGFNIRRTLIWMKTDKTKIESLRR